MGDPYDKERLVLENYIPINSLCILKRFLSEIGPIDPAFLIYEDWDMLLRLSEVTEFVHINETIAEYSLFGISTITGKEGLDFQKHYREKILTKHLHKVTPSIILKYLFYTPHKSTKDKEIEHLSRKINELNKQLEQERIEFFAKIRSLEDINSKYFAFLNEFQSITNSPSWRITKPLRSVKKIIKEVLGIKESLTVNRKIVSPISQNKLEILMDETKEKVEIVIVNYNGLNHLKRCIPSVLKTNYPNFSVTVVDNNSTDGSVDYLRENHPGVKIIKNTENLGFGLANEIAIQQSDANLIALLNNDTEVEPDWLSYLVCYLISDDSIASTTSKLFLMKHPSVINNAGGGMNCLGFGYDLGLYQPDSERFSQPTEVLFPSGAACLIRKDVYLKVGGFDKTFFMYHEDVDLGWRFWLFGYRVVFIPQSKVYHAFGGTSFNIGGHSFKETYGLQHAMRSLIKNYEMVNLIRYLTLFILLCIRRHPLYLTNVLKWNLKHLITTLKERRKIRRERAVSDDFLFDSGLIERVIHPFIHQPDYEIQSLESFIKSKNVRDSVLMGVTDSCNLGHGWHRKEIWYKDNQTKIRCTMSEAVVFLYSEVEEGSLILEIAGYKTPIWLNQSFSVFLNDIHQKDFTVSDDNMKTYEIPFKGVSGPIEIRIKINKTFIPDEYFQNRDKREIGIAVKSIRIISEIQEKPTYDGISVVIPTYNRAKELIRTLKGLEEQTLPKDLYEVIIIDDGSKDDTAQKVKDFISN
ncbi:MAG: glycosyltransferase, partial [Thermodesulfovibrionales bacterium]